MISIYPNKLEGRPVETHKTERRMTIATWIDANCSKGYAAGEPLALSVKVNDEIVPLEDWGTFVFLPADNVEMRVEPRGTDPFSITVALFAGVKAIFSMLIPALPGTPSVPGQGKNFNESSVRGNKVKLGDVIRESFGDCKIYPDYLVAPRKYFAGPQEQWTEMLLCIGMGEFDIFANNVRIGETPLLSLGSQASYEIFPPGANVSGNSASQNWYTAPEVGSSSTGAAGLELTFTTNVTPAAPSQSFLFSGYTVSGGFPADWSVGLILRMIVPYTYTVTDGGGTARDIVAGPLGMLNPATGDSIEVVGANEGFYSVNSYTPGSSPTMTLNFENGSAANSLQLGSGSAAIGPRGLRFRITSFSPSNITVERLTSSGAVDTSFPGFVPLTTSAATVAVDTLSGTGGWRGWFLACPENEVTSRIEFDMFMPGGLTHVGGKGDLNERTVSFEVQYRPFGSTGSGTSASFAYTANTLDQFGFTRGIDLPSAICPEVRIRKLGPAESEAQDHNTIQWYNLRSRLAAPTSYPGVTTIAIKVQSSDRIAAQTEALVWVQGTRRLPIREGGSWLPKAPTRDLAPAAIYVAKSLGYTDEQIDLLEMDRLHGVWQLRADKFDNPYTDESTAKDVLNDIFAAGFSELTIDRGRIRPVRDEPRTQLEFMYTPQNMTSELVRNPRIAANPDQFYGVDVTFTNRITWAEETVECRLPGVTGTKVEKINATGVMTKTKAYQFGMRRLRIHQYRTDTFSWSTDADARSARYLSYCAAADDVSGYPQSAVLRGLSALSGGGYLLRSGEPLTWVEGQPHLLMLRRPNGTASGPYPATRVDDYRLTVPYLDFTPVVDSPSLEPAHILFGTATRYCYPVLITDVSPSGLRSAQVEAVGYDARVYLSDDSIPT